MSGVVQKSSNEWNILGVRQGIGLEWLVYKAMVMEDVQIFLWILLGLPCCRLPFVRLQLQVTLVDVQHCKIVYNGVLRVQQVVEWFGAAM